MAALLLGLSLVGFSGISCSSSTDPSQPPVPLDSIYISSPAETLVVGGSLQYGFVAFDTSGTLVPSPGLSWASTDPLVAAVDTRGRVTGIGEGTATITATGGGATSNGVLQLVIQGFGWVSQRQGTPTVQNLNGVHFVDRQSGWAVGDVGTILTTSNAGLSWTPQTSKSTNYRLNGVWFVSPSHGFVVGSAGRLIETTNAGADWDAVTVSASGQELHAVQFVDAMRGFVVGNGGVILRTMNGGADWERHTPSVTTQNLRSVWAVDVAGTMQAWACGDLGTIVGTVNDGDTWTIVTPTVTSDGLRGMARLSADEAIAVGLNNRMARTDPGMGGPVWTLSGLPGEFANFQTVSWPVANRAYAGGLNQSSISSIQFSGDGGFSWQVQLLPGDASIDGNEIRHIYFFDADYGWAVGRGGLIVHTATGGF
ncbi:MAG: YCF48-related protein [Actinomycetota bacterium]